MANQLDEQEQLTNSWYYLEVPDIVQPVDEVCEVSGFETITSNDEDWYVESLPMKVSTSTFCDSIPHEVKEKSIEKVFDSSADFRETQCEIKDVSHISQIDFLLKTESEVIRNSTDVEIVSDVSTRTPTPSNNIITVDFAIQCGLDKDVSKDVKSCDNNMHLLSDPKVVLSRLKLNPANRNHLRLPPLVILNNRW